MTEITPRDDQQTNWKPQTYAVGAVFGTVFGLIAAYLYARAAEEESGRSGIKPRSPGTGELIALVLAALGLVRQISEMGKSPKKK